MLILSHLFSSWVRRGGSLPCAQCVYPVYLIWDFGQNCNMGTNNSSLQAILSIFHRDKTIHTFLNMSSICEESSWNTVKNYELLHCSCSDPEVLPLQQAKLLYKTTWPKNPNTHSSRMPLSSVVCSLDGAQTLKHLLLLQNRTAEGCEHGAFEQ